MIFRAIFFKITILIHRQASQSVGPRPRPQRPPNLVQDLPQDFSNLQLKKPTINSNLLWDR